LSGCIKNVLVAIIVIFCELENSYDKDDKVKRNVPGDLLTSGNQVRQLSRDIMVRN